MSAAEYQLYLYSATSKQPGAISTILLPPPKMLRTTIPCGALRSTLLLRPTLRTSAPIRSISQAAKSKPSTGFTLPSHNLRSPNKPNSIWQRLRFLHNSRSKRNGKPPSPDPTPNLGSPKAAPEAEPQSLGARMRKLGREYGWSGAGVYFALSALDFPFCYILVRTLGTDRIGEWNFNLFEGNAVSGCSDR